MHVSVFLCLCASVHLHALVRDPVRKGHGDLFSDFVHASSNFTTICVDILDKTVAVHSCEPQNDANYLVKDLQCGPDVVMGVCHVPVEAGHAKVVELFEKASNSVDDRDGRIEQPHENGSDSQGFKRGPYADGACNHLIEEVNLVDWEKSHGGNEEIVKSAQDTGHGGYVFGWEHLSKTAMGGKFVNVKLSEAEHTVLKAFCASVDSPMQEVLREMAMVQIHKQHFCCRNVRHWLKRHKLELDPRHNKGCYGYACYFCQHTEACKAGETEKLYIPDPDIAEMVTDEAKYIFEFDGSSLGPGQF